MHLIRLKKQLQDALGIPDIPMATLLINGSIHSLAGALSPGRHASPSSELTCESSGDSTPVSMSPHKEYMPVVIFRKSGSGVPLWLVHPGAGEILVYLQLISYITDRPVYALRARGFDGEPFFETLEECIGTYVTHIKRVQPHGPYAVIGYSFGGMFAFEIAKRLDVTAREAGEEGVRFLGILNLPPHVKQRIRQLNMTTAVLTLALFLRLVPDDDPETFDPNIQNMTHMDVLEEVFQRAPQNRVRELDITREKLLRWAEVSNALHALAWDYEPSGCVEGMDVFCAIPLRAVAKSKQEWREKQLVRWNDFVGEGGVNFHDVAGEHFSMIGSEHVDTFQVKLKEVMRARGI